MKNETAEEYDLVCADCGALQENHTGIGVNDEWVCLRCLAKRALQLLQVKAERDFALKGWVMLWNQFESVGLCTTKITDEQMLEKIRGKLEACS